MATRTPHRPTPIGLSLGSIIRVDTDTGAITLRMCDLVDGTPCWTSSCMCCSQMPCATPSRRRGCGEEARGETTTTTPRVAGEKDEKTLTDEPLEIAAVRFDASAETAVAAAYLRSVKARRVCRWRGSPPPSSRVSGSEPPSQREPDQSNDDGPKDGRAGTTGGRCRENTTGVVITAEETKRVKREAKARRPSRRRPSGQDEAAASRRRFGGQGSGERDRAPRRWRRRRRLKKVLRRDAVVADVEVEYARAGGAEAATASSCAEAETARLAKRRVTAARRRLEKKRGHTRGGGGGGGQAVVAEAILRIELLV